MAIAMLRHSLSAFRHPAGRSSSRAALAALARPTPHPAVAPTASAGSRPGSSHPGAEPMTMLPPSQSRRWRTMCRSSSRAGGGRATATPVERQQGPQMYIGGRPKLARTLSSRPRFNGNIRGRNATSAAGATSSAPLEGGPPPPAPGNAKPHLLLVDGMPWVYRAHFGYRTRLRNAAGTDTTVMYGFFSSLLAAMDIEPPVTHMAVVFDAPGLTFRHEMFSGYKGNRSPTPEEIIEALPQIDAMLRSMGIVVMREAGVEADDVVGTVALRANEQGALVSILTVDKDFKQLLDTSLRLVQPSKETKGTLQVYSVREFEAEFEGNISPPQFRDVLALAGDSVDNVPGVKRVGIKTALALISKYGSVEGVLENAPQTKPKGVRENLCSTEGAASARLSLELVQIRTSLAKPSTQRPLEDLRVPPAATMAAGVETSWAEMEFQSLMGRLRNRR